ncbi:adenylosuccinate lyase [Winogradskyella sp. A2]|uniref:adenylosuccinate lyase n=1 Tax=Winogradskyella sp. A2 TaxID=3366944 RepID=UPI00398C3BC6
MTKDQLYNELNYVNATRECRAKYANIVLADSELVNPLIEILFMVNDKISTRAAWILEFACKENINLILPHLNYFVANLSKLQLDSAIRPCAKIIEIIIELNYKKHDPRILKYLNTEHKEQIIAVSFDWMINDEKVAVKAYSMATLYYLGTEFDWIHEELKLILQRDYSHQSSGFKARAKYVLKMLGVIVPKCHSKNN